MLRRKITDQLLRWKARDDRKSLVVKGARQVGKTYSISQFAKENYASYIYIDFEKTPSLRRIFEGDLDTATIIKQITLNVPGACIIPGETVIFLDEIQNCPGARTALKFMTQDTRLLSFPAAPVSKRLQEVPVQCCGEGRQFPQVRR
ncbi:MAG: AAA family ATPase [Coriobacteriales bacterium]|jgi:predicted AAA+ superfamily ATPase|nr:AAA family ATPase [Coriobacteriales bacterium]